MKFEDKPVEICRFQINVQKDKSGQTSWFGLKMFWGILYSSVRFENHFIKQLSKERKSQTK